MKGFEFKSTPFEYGVGHIRPNRAMDPGLVYDLSIADYIDFLCTRSYNSSGMAAFIGKRYTCPSESIAVENFNYPTITIHALAGSFTITRKVKNVGGAPATYRARVRAPNGIAVEVAPEVLEFASVGEERTFNVTVRSSNASVGVGYVFGRLIWSDGVHHVRSPLVVNVKS